MSQFNYRARKPSGEVVEGVRDAAGVSELRSALSGEGLMLVEAKRERAFSGRGVAHFGLLRPRRSIRLTALSAFTREFRVLVGAGLPMAKALELLAQRDDDPRLAEAVRGTRLGIEQGLSLDAAAATQADAFDGLFLATLAAGVQTGRLEHALSRLEKFLSLRADLRRKARKALAYPLFLMALLGIVLTVLMLFVLPRFAQLYEEFDSQLPIATRMLMAMARTAPVWVPTAIVAIMLTLWAGRILLKAPALRMRLAGRLLRLPIVGPILIDMALVQGCYLLAMLLQAGMPLREALNFLADAESNAWIGAQYVRMRDSIEEGRAMSDVSAETHLFPPASAGMLRAGELSGELSEMLIAISQMHEEALDERMSRVLTLIEPLLLLIVGGVLGAVIIAVYLPIFGISSVVR